MNSGVQYPNSPPVSFGHSPPAYGQPVPASPYNSFVNPARAGCPNGTCGSNGCSTCAASPLNPAGVAPLADEFARVLPYGWVQGTGGDLYGTRHDWSTRLGLFAPLMIFEDDSTVAFFQASGLFSEQRTYGASTGLGFRRRHPEVDGLYGASLWYDVESDADRTFHQVGASIESLFPDFEFRANGYLPVTSSTHLRRAVPRLIGNNILVGTNEVVLTGFDAEIGRSIGGLSQLWAFGGYYFYTDRDGSLGQDVHGASMRVELRPAEDFAVSISLARDKVFKSSVFGTVTIPLRGLGNLFNGDCDCTLPRYGRLVQRRNRLAIHESDAIATNTVTGDPIFVAQVDSAAPAGGDGSLNAPFQTIGEGVTTAGQRGIVFVRNGSFNETVTLQNDQRLLADGFLDTTPYEVVSREGRFILPGQRIRSEVTMPSITSADPLATVQLCSTGQFVDNAEVAGFSITNSVGSAIFGVLNEGVSIRNNVLGITPQYGIALLNSSGSQFANSTAPTTATGIFNNTIDQNAQGGILLADLDLNAVDLTPLGGDLAGKGIALTSRGPLEAEVSGNTITNNANAAVVTGLAEEVQDQTVRVDAFGVYVTSVTDSQTTVAMTDNTLESNGDPVAIPGSDSSGGIGVVAGGSSQITATVDDSTFLTNLGVDIHGVVGDGTPASNAARLDLNINRNRLTQTQLAQTEDGTLAAGIRLVADIGTLNSSINSNVIEGDQTILDGTFDRMEAIYAISEDDAFLSTMLGVNGVNPSGGNGNDINTWHVGVGFNAENESTGTLAIQSAQIDAECVLKLHAGENGIMSTGSLGVTVEDSLLISRLPEAQIVDGLFIDAFGDTQATLTITDTNTQFAGPLPVTAPNRQWLAAQAGDQGQLTINLTRVSTLDSHTGFQDFIQLDAQDSATLNLNLNEVDAGETQQFAIDALATDSSRIVQSVVNSTFNGNGLGLINGEASVAGTLSSTISRSSFTTSGVRAIRFFADSNAPADATRLGVTLDGNNFVASPMSLDIFASSIDGSTLARVNMLGNTADGSYLLTQLEVPPGSATFELFDAGNNTPAVSTSGAITSSPTLLDISFP